ncbi:NAD(P)-binding domain-containing protein [Streptomyces sp. NPDC052496]|uniref:NAD(P)-dependent oxidoreductase n=1 Tax=Streptomyces sp. NPDC052496 TaxID=3154951 RepID=UPI00342425E2
MADVTVIGTGVIGSGVVRACAAAGLEVAVWNRTERRARQVAELSPRIRVHPTAAEAIRSSPVTLLCLLNYPVTHRVLEEAAAELAGRLVVQHSSGVPESVGPLQNRVTGAGGRFMEAAILNYPDAIGTDACFTVYGGAPEDFAELGPVTKAMAGQQVRLHDEPRYAKAYHVVASAFYYAFVSGFLECAAIAEHIGVPLGAFADSVPLYDPGFENTVRVGLDLIERRDYAYEQAPLTTHIDVLQNLTGAAEDAGVDASYLRTLRDRVRTALEQGHRREHIAILTEQFRARRGAAPQPVEGA